MPASTSAETRASVQRLLNAGVRLLRQDQHAEAERAFQRAVDADPDDAMSLALRGMARAKLGQQDAARTDATRAVALHPDDPRVLGRAARIHQVLGDPMAALTLFLAAREHTVPSASLEATIFQIALRTGYYREAFEALENSLALDPSKIDHRIAAARLYHNLRDHERALAIAEEILSEGHARADVHHLCADILQEMERHDEALEALERVIALNPDTPDNRFQAADKQISLGAMDRAAANLAKALEIEPDHAACRALLGQLALWRGALDEARSHAERVPEDSPHRGMALRVLGAAHILSGDLDAGEVHVEEALTRDPQDGEALIWRGEILRERGESDAAVHAIDMGIIHSEGYPIAGHISRLITILEEQMQIEDSVAKDAYAELLDFVQPTLPEHERGTEVAGTPQEVRRLMRIAFGAFQGNRTPRPTYIREDDPDETLQRLMVRPHSRFASRYTQELIRTRSAEDVLKRFDAMLHAYPDEPTVFCHIGELNLWLGDYDAAEAGFQGALAVTPRVRWAYIGLCAADLMRENHARALQWCKEGIRVFPPPGRTLYIYRGEIYRRLGRMDEALRDFEEGHSITPGRVSGWMNEALTRDALGQDVDFSQLWRDVCERAPSLVHDALAEQDATLTPRDASPDPQAIRDVFEHMLTMMRGNRSSDFITYFTADGALRFVPPPETPAEVFNQ